MGLYLRVMDIDPDNPRVPSHELCGIIDEFARTVLDANGAQAAIAKCSGAPLTSSEVTEAVTLKNTVPTGSTTAQQAARALRLLEIRDVLDMAASRTTPYDNEAAIKTRLGV